ncbi:hypothetical protein MFMK1_001565 [Metallumcola ferriviriculae]|uniref:Uncharacterized protein n=1 Tax=Metallumcola ferriviriculae TaxID=3039180 RepID=A0AAU0URD1_9FIRM|nr:hypothetical protein MFMK1_001565 [Desulfitibacteraceae bacterium MK1]
MGSVLRELPPAKQKDIFTSWQEKLKSICEYVLAEKEGKLETTADFIEYLVNLLLRETLQKSVWLKIAGFEGHTQLSLQESVQLGVYKILVLFAWPSVWYITLIYAIGKQFIMANGSIPTWVVLSIMVLGPGAEMAIGAVLLRQEGRSLTIQDFCNRIRLRWPTGQRVWIIAVIVFLLAMGISMLRRFF